MQSLICGIDLGTTYSCIAYVDEYGHPIVAPNAAGEYITPSVVQFIDSERIVGTEAKSSSMINPDNTVEMIKRDMGSNKTVLIEGKDYTPEEISSYILRKVVQDAEQTTGLKITDVVITCPAYFGITEREATAKAGEIAGLNVRSVINEPTAAAIAYGINEQSDQTVLVYDLGGGTFDVTIIKIEDGNITVVCTDGDHNLGGKDWDAAVVNYFADEWIAQTGSGEEEDPRNSSETLQDLWVKAEEKKKGLTSRLSTKVPIVHNVKKATIELTREKFNELTESLLLRTIELTKQACLEAKKCGVNNFDKLLLVGGSTRMPQVSKRLQQEFGIEPTISDPDQSVAKGAAIYGQKLLLDDKFIGRVAKAIGVESNKVDIAQIAPDIVAKAQEEVARDLGLQLKAVQKSIDTKITNVTSRSFGIIVFDPKDRTDKVSNIILRNTPLPATASQEFGTIEANQETAQLTIVENLSSDNLVDPLTCPKLGESEMTLPNGLPAGSPIKITFTLNEQGRLHMEAHELSSGQKIEVELQTESSSSEEDIKAAIARSKSLIIT